MNLLPTPRSLQRRPGSFRLPRQQPLSAIKIVRTLFAPDHPEGYALTISRRGVLIEFRETPGLRAAAATLRQLLREHGRKLPCLKIRDWPDFARRGVMLDISRGRVPKLETLLDLAERLADFKINELQLYTEHTFAYRKHEPVWKGWGALTAPEIRALDARCRELGIDLVPNQNSFGHLREFLAHPSLRPLAEVPAPYASDAGDFIRHPSTLAPEHPGTLPFLRGLYDELLPHFSSRRFNVGCDETWDLGRGRSRRRCARLGKGRVYLDFLKRIHREVAKRDRTMMFWGDIILHHPQLIRELPCDLIALNWGYEADHPFAREAARFAKAKIPFYVCPGTSTWMTLIGRHDNAFANLRAAARAGLQHGAAGYLITDWGDGGHPQPPAVSWPLYLYGAGMGWCAKSFDAQALAGVLSRDIYGDKTGRTARAALALGTAHLKFGWKETNQTPFGTVIAAPAFGTGEMICRNGPKCYARIPAKHIRAALAAVEKQLHVLQQIRRKPAASPNENIWVRELELAARMAAESCHIMLWQQALAKAGKGRTPASRQVSQLAQQGIRRLKAIERDYAALWPARNKGTPKHSAPWLRWRMEDYRLGRLHYPPEEARRLHPKFLPAE
jgi:hexosaminidase